jgi:hypothetical protein
MKRIQLILLSVWGAVFSAPACFRTANAAAAAEDEPTVKDVAADVNALQLQLDEMRTSYEERIAALTEQNALLTSTPAAATDPLGLGGAVLPKGIELKDVLWRKEAGLSTKHAIQAALAQKRSLEKARNENAEEAKKTATKKK